MRYLIILAAMTALLYLASCGRNDDFYTETEDAPTRVAQEPEAAKPHPAVERPVDPDRRARIEEEKRIEEEQEKEEEATQDERSKLGKLLDSLGYALFRENSTEKAKQIIAEIAPLYEKFRKEDETSYPATVEFMDKFKEQINKITSYLEKDDIDNARACVANLGYYWSEWRRRKMME